MKAYLAREDYRKHVAEVEKVASKRLTAQKGAETPYVEEELEELGILN